MGRSPDNFPSYLTGLATQPELFNELLDGAGDRLDAYYRKARREDLFHVARRHQPAGVAPCGRGDRRRRRHFTDLAGGRRGRRRGDHQRAQDDRHRGYLLS